MNPHPARTKASQDKATEFLKVADDFKLGHLITEGRHPKTVDLHQISKDDSRGAFELLREVDLEALDLLVQEMDQLEELAFDVNRTFEAGGRVFLCGCGATGRLAVHLEYLWRLHFKETAMESCIVSLMAGGDVALVHALEGFEDRGDLGARQLLQGGFGTKDLLIAITEGGETPFVIGAVEQAAKMAAKSYFLCCNPSEVLMTLERSRRVIENPKIRTQSFCVGPMALAGSTRMQASTALMLAVGFSLFYRKDSSRWEGLLSTLKNAYGSIGLKEVSSFSERESAIYKAGDHTIYQADSYAITILTDTTERAPTFSLPHFDNLAQVKKRPSLSYLMLPECESADSSWQAILGRSPRLLDWPEIHPKSTREYFLGFDFGRSVMDFRKRITSGRRHHLFHIFQHQDQVQWELDDLTCRWAPTGERLLDHILLKMVLNAHSTIVMGRLDRYLSNLMTYVLPTNGKLIDRAARYTVWLAETGNSPLSYEQAVFALFSEMEQLNEGESVIVKVLQSLELP